MIPVAIPSPGGACFAAYDPAPGPAVLICPPFGAEAPITARVWRDLARRLAARGVAALRPDLPGTGDSAGAPEEPGRVAAWRGAVDACLAWLAARHGGRVALFGHRFGALLALDAVARGAATERLVLLDPPASGQAFARALRARARLEGLGAPPEGQDFVQAWGVPVAAETLADLAGLAAAPLPAGGVPPTLLVLEEGRRGGGGASWDARLRAAGAVVTVAPFEGYAAFVPLPALAASPPRAVLGRVADLLAEWGGNAAAAAPSALLPTPAPAGGVAWRDGEEVPVRFGPEGGRLFGLLCRPARPLAAGAPAVLLPSIAALPRHGMGRMWADLARRLAAQGVASLRFDMAGVGESEGEPGVDPLADTYRPGRIADLRAALDSLAAAGFARAVAVGLCSGGYVALQAAAEEPRLLGVLAGNPQFLNRQSAFSFAALNRPAGAREPAPGAAAAAPPAAAQAPGDGAPRPSAGAGLRRLLRRASRACPDELRHLLRGLGAEERAGRAHLRRLLDRGCAVHLVYAVGDTGHLRLRRAFGEAPRLPAGAALTEIEGADHGFTDRRHRALFLDAAAAFALRLAGAPADARAPSSPPPRPRAPLEIAA